MAIFRKQKRLRLAFEINEEDIKSIDQKITAMFENIERSIQDINKKFVFYFDDGVIIEFNCIEEISKYAMQGAIAEVIIVYKKQENGIKIIFGRKSTQEEANIHYYIISNNEQWFNDSSRKVGILIKEFELGYSVLYKKKTKIIKYFLSLFVIILSVYAGIKFIITANITSISLIIVTIIFSIIIAYFVLVTIKSLRFLYPDSVFKFGGKQKKKQIFLVGLRALIGGAILGILTSVIASMII
jgi:hypothetical protein